MKVCIYSLGCKVNIYESEYVINLLKKDGFEIVSDDEVADIYIVNTCSVTNEADKKSRKIINKVRRLNNDAIIVVMGCYSQVNSDKIDADIIIGNKDKSKIVELINDYISSNKKYKKIYDLRKINEFESMEIDCFDSHTRAFVKIQDGCNAFCSYCIIPYTRGSVRSKDPKLVIREVTNLVKSGYKEIVLTGIHTGKYGMDLNGYNLEKLLRELVKIEGIYRIRLSSIEINEITDGILELIKSSSVMASHLHIPLQSGSNKILKLMNRKYDSQEFIKRVLEIKSVRNDMSITTDVIVGFPGEGEEEFCESVEVIKKVGFTRLHIFPYSSREGTVASRMNNQIDSKIKKERVNKLIELSNSVEYMYYKKYIGCVMEGVSEVRGDNSIVVHTSNFIPVVIDGNIKNNEIVRVKIKKVDDNNLVYGEVVL